MKTINLKNWVKKDDTPFTSTQMAIIILLRAPGTIPTRRLTPYKFAPIPGNIHLINELFLIWNTPLGRSLLDELQFELTRDGQYDETIELALENLKEAGYVCINKTREFSLICLTNKGERISDHYGSQMRGLVIDLFTDVKTTYNHLNLKLLLDIINSS